MRLPFLGESLFPWADGVPVRYAGGGVTGTAEKLYFIGLIAPRGPQIPSYGMQAKLVATMIDLDEDGRLRHLADTERPLRPAIRPAAAARRAIGRAGRGW